MTVTLRQLNYFLVLSKELHFGRAAKTLNISQPPLSISIRQLEESLGFPLLDRGNRSIELTPAGGVFAEHARRAINQLDAAEKVASRIAEGATGTLTIGYVPTMLFRCFPKLLKSFQEEHPGIDIYIHEVNSSIQVEDLLGHSIDFGFCHTISCPSEINSLFLEEEELLCCVPLDHRLSRRVSVSIDELRKEKILIVSREYAEYHYDRIFNLLKFADIAPASQLKTRCWLTIIALVSKNFGISIVPASLKQGNYSDVSYLNISDVDTKITSNLIWREDLTSLPEIDFLEHVRRNILL